MLSNPRTDTILFFVVVQGEKINLAAGCLELALRFFGGVCAFQAFLLRLGRSRQGKPELLPGARPLPCQERYLPPRLSARLTRGHPSEAGAALPPSLTPGPPAAPFLPPGAGASAQRRASSPNGRVEARPAESRLTWARRPQGSR